MATKRGAADLDADGAPSKRQKEVPFSSECDLCPGKSRPVFKKLSQDVMNDWRIVINRDELLKPLKMMCAGNTLHLTEVAMEVRPEKDGVKLMFQAQKGDDLL